MTATAHALVAGVIVRSVPDTATASILAFGSHYIMDCIPHWDFGTNWRKRSKSATGLLAIIDTLLAFTVAYILFAGKVGVVPITLVTIAALIPDWLETPWYIFFARQNKHEPDKNAGTWEKVSYMIYKLPNMFHTKAQFPLGLFTQIATVAFFWMLLK